MLFKVFTVLGAISLMGGFANCQMSALNQNEQMVKLLFSMMGSAAESNKNSNENQLMQLLLSSVTDSMKNSKLDEQMMQMLMKMMGSGVDATKNSNENMIMQLLISMMGGSKDATKLNENQIMQFLASLMGGSKDTTKLNENQIMQLLISMMGGSKDSTKLNENQMMQFLTSLMGGAKDTTKMNENQIMQLLMMSMLGGATDAAKSNENQIIQMLMKNMLGGATDVAKTNENQMIQMLMKSMLGGATDTTKSNENQMIQLLMMSMLGGASDMDKNRDAIAALAKLFPGSEQIIKSLDQLKMLLMLGDETKKPAQCMAAKNMEKNSESEMAAWIEMLKADSLKELFGVAEDYEKFTEMVKYVEGSKSDWLSAFLKSMKGNNWLMNIADQIISMIEKDKKMKDQLMKFIEGNKEVLDFTVKSVEWMKLQNFSESSPMVQKIVNIFLDMDLKASEVDEAWFDNYMNWVDCTFGKEGEISAVMKTIGMLSKVDDMLMPFLKNMIDSPKKIKLRMQLNFGNLLRCDKTNEVVAQSLYNILILTTSKEDFCTTKSFATTQRVSKETSKMGTYIQSLGTISNSASSIWKIDIMRDGKTVARDVDVNFVPKDGDLIYFNFTSV